MIAARATLGSVAKIKAFLFLFPPGLALFLGLTFALFGDGDWWISVAWAVPWLVFAPWMAWAPERRTTRAVDRLVGGMARARARRS